MQTAMDFRQAHGGKLLQKILWLRQEGECTECVRTNERNQNIRETQRPAVILITQCLSVFNFRKGCSRVAKTVKAPGFRPFRIT